MSRSASDGRLGHISAWLDVLASDGSPQGSDGPALTCGDPRRGYKTAISGEPATQRYLEAGSWLYAPNLPPIAQVGPLWGNSLSYARFRGDGPRPSMVKKITKKPAPRRSKMAIPDPPKAGSPFCALWTQVQVVPGTNRMRALASCVAGGPRVWCWCPAGRRVLELQLHST